MRVLSWNLFHGRSLPPARENLCERFAALLARWEWDVALLQEAPPWWPALLASRSGAEQRAALTSRNWGLALRRSLGERYPDALKSNAGGCNAVLVRGSLGEHRAVRLRLWPERRVAQLVRLPQPASHGAPREEVCVANFHASSREGLAEDELLRLWEHALRFASGTPMIVGGDLNLRSPRAPDDSFLHVASRDVDHLFVRGLRPQGPAQTLPREVSLDGRSVQLSDHPPLIATLDAG